MVTRARTSSIWPRRQVVNPYTMARPIQMKWNGTVSRPGHMYIATAHTQAMTDHAATRPCLCEGVLIADIAHRLDPFRPVQFGAEPADADIDEVAAGIEGE